MLKKIAAILLSVVFLFQLQTTSACASGQACCPTGYSFKNGKCRISDAISACNVYVDLLCNSSNVAMSTARAAIDTAIAGTESPLTGTAGMCADASLVCNSLEGTTLDVVGGVTGANGVCTFIGTGLAMAFIPGGTAIIGAEYIDAEFFRLPFPKLRDKLPNLRKLIINNCAQTFNGNFGILGNKLLQDTQCTGQEDCYRDVCSIGDPYLFCDQTGPEYADTCMACLNDKKGIWTAFGCIESSAEGIVTQIMRIGIGIAGGLALLMCLVAAFMLTTSQGEPKTTGEAKEILQAAVIGLLFIIFSVTILQFIGVTILHIPGFGT